MNKPSWDYSWRPGSEKPEIDTAVFGECPEFGWHDIAGTFTFLVRCIGSSPLGLVWVMTEPPHDGKKVVVTQWRYIEYPKPPPKQNIGGDRCPVCGSEAQIRCRCILADCACSNGHEWHTCPVHGVVVIGRGDHTASQKCSCPTEGVHDEQRVHEGA